MFRKIIEHQIFHVATIGAIALGVLACVFPDLVPGLPWVANYAVQLMLFYLFAGLVMLFLRQSDLTFAFFGGCVILCFFLKYSVRGDGIERWRQNMINKGLPLARGAQETPLHFKIAHINLSNVGDRSELVPILNSTEADILSVHEVTPAWAQWLQDSLGRQRPYHHTLVDIGIYGMAIYSKHKLTAIDTFYYEDVPNLRGKVEISGAEFNFISIHTLPALDEFSKCRLDEHLTCIAKEVGFNHGPLLVFGDFNAVSWSKPVQYFLDKTGLMESRAGFMPSNFSGNFPFWEIPLDHVFYSGHFICTSFQNINNSQGRHLGILGSYYFPERSRNAEKTIE